MITREEIEGAAEEFGIHTSYVQRDYVHGWLLAGLYSSSPLSRSLVLKGGNCLRKAYFRDSRYSRDLDFTTRVGIPEDELGREFNLICESLSPKIGIAFDTSRTRVEKKRRADRDKHISEARLYFKDFYGRESQLVLSIRVDITQYDRLYLPVQERELLHPYSDWQECSVPIRCVKLEELLASKMRCLLQRRHIPDLFDLVYSTLIAREVEVSMREMLSTFFRITVFGRSPGVVKGLFLDLPLEAFGRYWAKYIDCPKATSFTFESAQDKFFALIEEILPGRAIHDRSSTFFPSSLRNPIMEAGERFTLLRLHYSGRERLVEPYSLIFKTRKDGEGKEYFYAYDTTGGTSSKPGIRSFLPGRVEAIEVTDTTFEPRFTVDLRKAGSSEIAGEFDAQRQRRARLGSMDAWGQRTDSYPYEVQCPYCDKRFRRKKRSTKLNKHKDKFGNRCHGRIGHLV